jgi:pimeloyl-ACP methyl ester carboxylesterase
MTAVPIDAEPNETPSLVLIHGGHHTAGSWEPTIRALHRRAPEIPVLAPDLPGRGTSPADLNFATLEDSVTTVIDAVETKGLRSVVLVAHSMGGLVIPAVAARLGSDVVRRMIFVASFVPPDGTSIVESLTGVMAAATKPAALKRTAARPLRRTLVRHVFCNGMTAAQRTFNYAHICGESRLVAQTPVDRSAMPRDIPKTWVFTRRDRALSPRQQRRCIENLGGVDEIVEIDACHNVMISHPDRLAELLASHARG